MKKIIFSKTLLLIVGVFWIAENWYFGWNWKPMSNAEIICDRIVEIGLGVCLYLYLKPIFTLLERKVERYEHDNKLKL